MKLTDCFNPSYLKDSRRIKKRFSSATPFEHILLRNFLDKSRAKKLATALLKEKFYEKDTDLFKFSQTDDLKNTKNKVLREFYDFFKSKEFIDFISDISGAKISQSIDASGFIYGSTDYLLPHDDVIEGRKLAYILYLSSGFSSRDGGSLDFFATKKKHPVKITKRFYPDFNSLMIFGVSHKSFHQVSEVLSNKKRLTIGGWLHG